MFRDIKDQPFLEQGGRSTSEGSRINLGKPLFGYIYAHFNMLKEAFLVLAKVTSQI